MFADARFGQLGIKRARLAVGWDVMTARGRSPSSTRWLQGAQAAGVEPLVSFMHSRTIRRTCRRRCA